MPGRPQGFVLLSPFIALNEICRIAASLSPRMLRSPDQKVEGNAVAILLTNLESASLIFIRLVALGEMGLTKTMLDRRIRDNGFFSGDRPRKAVGMDSAVAPSGRRRAHLASAPDARFALTVLLRARVERLI
jgi:hypothetical protein